MTWSHTFLLRRNVSNFGRLSDRPPPTPDHEKKRIHLGVPFRPPAANAGSCGEEQLGINDPLWDPILEPSSWTLPSKDLLNVRVRIFVCLYGIGHPQICALRGRSPTHLGPPWGSSCPKAMIGATWRFPLCLAFPLSVSWLCACAVFVLRSSG